ncbi:hypothetical protein B0H12DRAFT_1076624 [Mycena haematopus]|nr:hypothetical protein B0H12DRAFT_1076624 [Mycena haematopus]
MALARILECDLDESPVRVVENAPGVLTVHNLISDHKADLLRSQVRNENSNLASWYYSNCDRDELPAEPSPACVLPKTSIGDLFSKNLLLALHVAQPYPGEDPLQEGEVFNIECFGVCKLNETQHIIFDHETGDNVLLPSVFLEFQEFNTGLWYARKRHEILGLSPDAVPREERYLLELGDGETVAGGLWVQSPLTEIRNAETLTYWRFRS